jgi:hypothetical protein
VGACLALQSVKLQFLPIDMPWAVHRFLTYWKPAAAVFVVRCLLYSDTITCFQMISYDAAVNGSRGQTSSAR